MFLALLGENAHPADIEALKQNKLQGVRPASIIKRELDGMHAELKRRQQKVADIIVKYKNDELEGGPKAVDMEGVKTENGKSLSAMKKEIHELSLKIAENRHMLERSEHIEKAMSGSSQSRDVE